MRGPHKPALLAKTHIMIGPACLWSSFDASMTGSQPSLTARVCERIVACGRAPLEARLLPMACQLFLDGIAVGVAGARLEEAPRILAEHFADPLTGTGGGTAASLLGL